MNKLILENFKIHQYLELDFVGLNVLTGKNSGGKSTVFQSMLLLRQSYPNSSSISGVDLNGKLCELGDGADLFYKKAQDDHIKISIHENTNFYSWFIDLKDKDFRENYFTAEDQCDYEQCSLFGNDFQYISADRLGPRESYISKTFDVVHLKQISLLHGRGELVVHFLHEFSQSTIAPQLCHPNEKSRRLLDQVSAWMSSISENIFVVPEKREHDYSLKYAYEQKDTIFDGADNLFKASNVGFGLSYALPIVVALLSATEKSVILLENPEAHLHPAGQASIAKLITRCASMGAQVFVETHSDHIINNICIETKKFEDSDQQEGLDRNLVKIYHFDRDPEHGFSSVEEVRIVEDGRIDNSIPGFFDQASNDLSIILDF